jgi:hypothetical protein
MGSVAAHGLGFAGLRTAHLAHLTLHFVAGVGCRDSRSERRRVASLRERRSWRSLTHLRGVRGPRAPLCNRNLNQEIAMSRRLTTALAAAALCGLGAAYAQTTYDPAPADNPRNMPADVTPDSPAVAPPLSTEGAPVTTSPTYDEGTATFIREQLPSDRAAVQAETGAAMRANRIPHGELSTPEQDKGSTRALTPYERGAPSSSY